MNFRLALVVFLFVLIGLPSHSQESKVESKKEAVKDSTKRKSIFSARVRGSKTGDKSENKDSVAIKSSAKVRSSNAVSKKDTNLSNKLKEIKRERNTQRTALEAQKRKTDSIQEITRAKAREAQAKSTTSNIATKVNIAQQKRNDQKSMSETSTKQVKGKSVITESAKSKEVKLNVSQDANAQEAKQISGISKKESGIASNTELNILRDENAVVEENKMRESESVPKEDRVRSTLKETETKIDSVSLRSSARLNSSKPGKAINTSNEKVNVLRDDLQEETLSDAEVDANETSNSDRETLERENKEKLNLAKEKVTNEKIEPLDKTLLEYNPNGIRLYSNQAQTELTMEFKNAAKGLEYEIINNRGKSMYKSSAASSTKETVNISRFKTGSYFVRLKSETHEDFIKFVLK
jgi:hypothetical protein